MNEYRVIFGLERWSNKKQKSNSQNVFEVDVSGFVIVGKFMQLTVNVNVKKLFWVFFVIPCDYSFPKI